MKKSRMILWLTDVIKVRPILIAAFLFILADSIYVNFIFRYPSLGDRNGQRASITGKVQDKVLDADGRPQSITVGNCLCYVNRISGGKGIGIGDYVNLKGPLYEFEGPMNIGEADMKKYYASKHVFYYCYVEKAEIYRKGKSVRESFLSLRRKISEDVLECCTFEGGTVNTLLLGDKSNLPKERKELYKRAGTAHFLVISGLHISAIGSFLYSFMRKTGIRQTAACLISISFLIMYGILVGFSVSVIRAVIMFLVRLFADIFGELYDMMNALSLAATVSIVINPLSILDTAFIYSYVTVFAISLYLTYIHTVPYRKNGFFRFFREALRIPFILLLFILPVTLRLSNEYSLFSVIINSVLAPLAAPILLLGFLCMLFSMPGLLFPVSLFDFLLHLLLSFIDGLCEISTKLPALSMMRRPSLLEITVYYLLLAFYFLYLKKDGSLFAKLFTILNLLYFMGCGILFFPKVSMLYVGQGECVAVKTGIDTAVISDCGSSSEKNIVEYKVIPFLKASGIKRIQTVFVSHSDSDHSGGVSDLILASGRAGIVIDSITLAAIPFEDDEKMISTVNTAESMTIPVNYIRKGAKVRYGAFTFRCLSPDTKKLTGESNADSMVLVASAGDYDVLLTGDITSEIEERIIPGLSEYTIDVLKIAHHGSKTSSSESFIKAASPKTAVISAGINNSFSHPSKETTDTLARNSIPYFVTKEYGEIDVYYFPGLKNRVYVRTVKD